MYIWKVTLLVHWSWQENGDGDEEEYDVAAKTWTDAVGKASKVALAKSRSFTETDEETEKQVRVYPVEVLDVPFLERGVWLDA